MCFARMRMLSHMADTLPAYSSAFLAAVAALVAVEDGRVYRTIMGTIGADRISAKPNIFLQNKPNLCPETLDLFGFA